MTRTRATCTRVRRTILPGATGLLLGLAIFGAAASASAATLDPAEPLAGPPTIALAASGAVVTPATPVTAVPTGTAAGSATTVLTLEVLPAPLPALTEVVEYTPVEASGPAAETTAVRSTSPAGFTAEDAGRLTAALYLALVIVAVYTLNRLRLNLGRRP